MSSPRLATAESYVDSDSTKDLSEDAKRLRSEVLSMVQRSIFIPSGDPDLANACLREWVRRCCSKLYDDDQRYETSSVSIDFLHCYAWSQLAHYIPEDAEIVKKAVELSEEALKRALDNPENVRQAPEYAQYYARRQAEQLSKSQSKKVSPTKETPDGLIFDLLVGLDVAASSGRIRLDTAGNNVSSTHKEASTLNALPFKEREMYIMERHETEDLWRRMYPKFPNHDPFCVAGIPNDVFNEYVVGPNGNIWHRFVRSGVIPKNIRIVIAPCSEGSKRLYVTLKSAKVPQNNPNILLLKTMYEDICAWAAQGTTTGRMVAIDEAVNNSQEALDDVREHLNKVWNEIQPPLQAPKGKAKALALMFHSWTEARKDDSDGKHHANANASAVWYYNKELVDENGERINGWKLSPEEGRSHWELWYDEVDIC
ncbi:hypothetical protein V8F33_007286 [Rhypophila sp. PSN 637]